MATTTLYPVPHFLDENSTPRSFSPLPPPSRPSLEASSMKSRKSFLDILGSARRVAAAIPTTPSGSKLKQEAKLAEDLGTTFTSDHATGAVNRDPQNKLASASQKPEPIASASSNSSKPLQSKSRTILRVISTKFRSRSPISPTSPPPNANLQAKQNREAALRERGLLPPLQPNKDLSKQEAEQDRHIPVVPPDPDPADEIAAPSAADLIKHEWEAKNAHSESPQVDERDRMNSFRFGGMSTKPSELETLVEVSTPYPSPSINGATTPPPPPPKDTPPRALSHRSSGSADRGKLEPYNVPLPSSPLPTPPPTPSKAVSRKSASITSTASPPPSSFHFPRNGDAESSSSINTRSGSIPRKSTSSAPPPTNLSLTPSSRINSPGDSSSPASPTTSIPYRRSESLTQMPSISESVSSVLTPSLDPPSQAATTISTLNTVDSLGAVAAGANNNSAAKGKNNLLKVKTHEHIHNIPMIVESPVEDAVVAEPMAGEVGTIPEEVSLPLSPVSEAHLSPGLAVPPVNLVPVRRGRGFTDPGKGPTKRKSFNLFKRSQSPGSPGESENNGRTGSSQSKKISVSTSLTNLRRAASSFTRPKPVHDSASTAPSRASTTAARTFDASHLPPSPTLPSQFVGLNNGAGMNGCGATGVGLRPPRRPIDPTLHSRGSILMETNAIQDEEVRRMTELAFLG